MDGLLHFHKQILSYGDWHFVGVLWPYHASVKRPLSCLRDIHNAIRERDLSTLISLAPCRTFCMKAWLHQGLDLFTKNLARNSRSTYDLKSASKITTALLRVDGLWVGFARLCGRLLWEARDPLEHVGSWLDLLLHVGGIECHPVGSLPSTNFRANSFNQCWFGAWGLRTGWRREISRVWINGLFSSLRLLHTLFYPQRREPLRSNPRHHTNVRFKGFGVIKRFHI